MVTVDPRSRVHRGMRQRRHVAPRRPHGPTRALASALLSAVVVCGRVGGAHGEASPPRFGDSTWVSPTGSFEAAPSSEGPRVAPRDRERGWETALRIPFRVAFFPLRVVSSGLEYAAGVLGDRIIKPPHPSKSESPRTRPTIGPHVDLDRLNDNGVRAIGLGPSLTLKGVPTSTSLVTLRGSWSAMDGRRVGLTGAVGERRPVALRLAVDYDYRPNHRYFGIGNHSARGNRAHYLLEDTHVGTVLSFGASSERQVGLVAGYSHASPRRGYQGRPPVEDVFTPESAPFMHRTSRELYYGMRTNLAAVDDRKEPSLGVHVRAEFRHATGARSQDPDFHQWQVETRGYVPVFDTRRVLVFRGALAGVDPTGGATVMPFYRLVRSEGALRFAGYASQRFHDHRLALARLEYRWKVHRHLSALALYELGEVAPLTRSLTARDVHISFGGGVRFATSEEKMMRAEVAKSVEGLHVALYFGGDF